MRRKEKIMDVVRTIDGKRYHQGTFARVAHKFPRDYEEMDSEISKEYKKLDRLLDEFLKKEKNDE